MKTAEQIKDFAIGQSILCRARKKKYDDSYRFYDAKQEAFEEILEFIDSEDTLNENG